MKLTRIGRLCAWDLEVMPREVSASSSGPRPRRNSCAIAALLLGIGWLFWLGSILALVFGFIALRQVKRSEGTQTGRGMAIAGIVFACLWLGLGLALIVDFVLTYNPVPPGRF